MKDNSIILAALSQLIELASKSDSNNLAQHCSKLFELVNIERIRVGLHPLKINAALNKLAEMKSQDMAQKNYFNHNSPTYGSPFEMLTSYGISYNCAGENLAIDKCVENAHSNLMKSKTHRANIMNPAFTEIGIGVCVKGDGSYIYTQLFI